MDTLSLTKEVKIYNGEKAISLTIEAGKTCSVQFSPVTQSCLTLCDPMNCSMPALPVLHQLPESAQTHVH